MAIGQGKKNFLIDYALVFIGDLLPYSVIFLLTLMVSYKFGLEPAGSLSLAFAYVAVVTTMVCGPNLLSLRRRIVGALSAGAVVVVSLGLRVTVIAAGALLVVGGLFSTGTTASLLSLIALLFVGRFLETAVDGPATSVQYLRGPLDYFLLRLAVSVLVCGITGVAVFTAGGPDLPRIAFYYVMGSAAGFLLALAVSSRLLRPVAGLLAECRGQVVEFSKFFVASALFVVASRIHPMIINVFAGQEAAGQFALVQNLFSSLALAASGVAGVFFWSRNRKGAPEKSSAVPWRWLLGGLLGGFVLGILGGIFLDLLFLRPLGSSFELRATGWLLCLSTPLFLTQSIMSNLLVLLNRDREMLALSAFNAIGGLLLITLLVDAFGLVGAALSVGLSALVSTILGIYIVRSAHE